MNISLSLSRFLKALTYIFSSKPHIWGCALDIQLGLYTLCRQYPAHTYWKSFLSSLTSLFWERKVTQNQCYPPSRKSNLKALSSDTISSWKFCWEGSSVQSNVKESIVLKLSKVIQCSILWLLKTWFGLGCYNSAWTF